MNSSGALARGYVYLGGQMVAIQSGNAVSWVHQDPVTKSQRVTNSSGTVVSTIELDPWGGDTNRSSNQAFQPKRFTSYNRDVNGSDEAMFRRYNRWHGRFDQPDPYDGSYTLTDPQSFNRYAYVQNDPVNFTDPTGLMKIICGPGGSVGDGDMIWHCEYFPDTSYRWGGYVPREPPIGPDPEPEPEPEPAPSLQEDPCDSKYAPEVERDISQIATTSGGRLDAGWKIRVPRGLSSETAVSRLEASGFVQFYSYNRDHPGVNLQGQLNGRWYHVTVSPYPGPNAAVNANRGSSGPNNARNSRSNRSSTGIREITAHCETNKPDSWAHRWDYLKSFFW